MNPAALRLIAITDDLRDGRDGLIARAQAAARGGTTMVQLRLKHVDPRDLVAVARGMVAALPIPVIVNDRADVAVASGAAGVHLGIDGLPALAVRRMVPSRFVIGASVSSDQELEGALGADYVGIGPVFAPGADGDAIGAAEFARLARRTGLPAVAIGGIDDTNCRSVLEAGAHGVAMIRGIFSAPDPEHAARALSSAIES